jgi:hypothetical protein
MKVTFTTSLNDWLAFAEHEMRGWAAYRETTSIWLWSTAIICGGIAAYVFADVSPGVGQVQQREHGVDLGRPSHVRRQDAARESLAFSVQYRRSPRSATVGGIASTRAVCLPPM